MKNWLVKSVVLQNVWLLAEKEIDGEKVFVDKNYISACYAFTKDSVIDD